MPETLKPTVSEDRPPLVQHLPAEGTEEAVSDKGAGSGMSPPRDLAARLHTEDERHRIPSSTRWKISSSSGRRGHCEYFASALARFSRCPRLIPREWSNGFKGGDWHNLTQTINVRQKHAHSGSRRTWAGTRAAAPAAITLDATPVMDRDELVAQVGGVSTNIRPLARHDPLRLVFCILGYDASRRDRLLYTPMKVTIRDVRRGYAMPGPGPSEGSPTCSISRASAHSSASRGSSSRSSCFRSWP